MLAFYFVFVFLRSKDIINKINGLIQLLSVLSVHQVTYKVLWDSVNT